MGLARSIHTLARVNQEDGFDCPGCAWPDPGERSPAEFCENGAKAVASEATRARAGPDFFARYSVQELADHPDMWLEKAGRLVHPMLLDDGATHYRPVSWDEAFALIKHELHSLPTPDAATFYTSGRTSNEAAFLYQLFVRQFGTNNLPDCSNMCHESSGLALGQVIGTGKGTVRLEDFEHADSIWIIGQNPGTNHPRMLGTLQAAARRGCPIISVNPLREPGLVRFKHPQEIAGMLGRGTPLASLFIPVRIGGDIAFFKGVMKAMLEDDARQGALLLDRAFIDSKTTGFAEFRADLERESWGTIEAGSGIGRALIQQAADIALRSRRMICCWAMGITQHLAAVANVQSIVNLLLLGGHFGKLGAGACPVRGHSNVQGDRTMGVGNRMPRRFLDALGAEFGFAPPREHGLDVVDSIRAMHDGRVRVLFAMGGNFLSATPDTEFTARAIRNCSLTAHVSTKLNRSHLITGHRALILPCLGRTERDVQASCEQFVTVEDSMSNIHMSRGFLAPASEHLLSEVSIVCRLAAAVLRDSRVDWKGLSKDYRRIREHISRVVSGFEDYEARVQAPGGFHLPNPARDANFPTDTGKAKFTVHAIPDLAPNRAEFMLTTIRTHDQFNTTIYGPDDRYRGIRGGRRVVLMNAEDMAARGLSNCDLVDLISNLGQKRVAREFRVVQYDIPRGCAATYFPEANVLVPVDYASRGSNQPASKSVPISIERSKGRQTRP
jgi:molybdopterin-dependent oxidoreductase alpha subunit